MPMHPDDREMCCSPLHGSGGNPQTTLIVLIDALGNTWCQDCQHRGELVNWGRAHGWPELEIHPYAMAEGAYYWQVTATQGDESRVWTFLGLVEMLDATPEVA